MTTQAQARIAQFFDPAVQTLGETLKAGIKAQEEMAKWWTDALDRAGLLREWQKRSQSIFSEAIPVAQKNAETWLRLSQQNYRRGMDLLKKALEPEGPAAKDVQAHAQALYQDSLNALRESTQAAAQNSVKMMEQWTSIFWKH